MGIGMVCIGIEGERSMKFDSISGSSTNYVIYCGLDFESFSTSPFPLSTSPHIIYRMHSHNLHTIPSPTPSPSPSRTCVIEGRSLRVGCSLNKRRSPLGPKKTKNSQFGTRVGQSYPTHLFRYILFKKREAFSLQIFFPKIHCLLRFPQKP